jgi:hypothetical protein
VSAKKTSTIAKITTSGSMAVPSLRQTYWGAPRTPGSGRRSVTQRLRPRPPLKSRRARLVNVSKRAVAPSLRDGNDRLVDRDVRGPTAAVGGTLERSVAAGLDRVARADDGIAGIVEHGEWLEDRRVAIGPYDPDVLAIIEREPGRSGKRD